MTKQRNEENERIKYTYLQFLKEAKQYDTATVNKVADAILRFERSTRFKPLKKFTIEQAMNFKRQLASDSNARTGKPLSKATIDGTLRAVKAFVFWLAGQPGFKSRIRYADADYFNPSAKDARIAHARRDAPYPTMEQCRHAFNLIPENDVIERRNKALFAFLMLTGARDGAIASMRLKHINLMDACVYQDAREVRTKAAKTFTTWFMPVDEAYREYFTAWVRFLQVDLLFGHDDALFPKPQMGLTDGSFAVVGISPDPYANAGAIREAIKEAFTSAGLPAFGPHSFRKTLVKFGDSICATREQFKAWSQNIGHDSVVTTVSAYCPVSRDRQAELIRDMRRA